MSLKFDKEYATQWSSEVDYLLSKGIKPTFVKKNEGIRTYKYTKTDELFKTLTEFYDCIKK